MLNLRRRFGGFSVEMVCQIAWMVIVGMRVVHHQMFDEGQLLIQLAKKS
jgi:hypothetical protein